MNSRIPHPSGDMDIRPQLLHPLADLDESQLPPRVQASMQRALSHVTPDLPGRFHPQHLPSNIYDFLLQWKGRRELIRAVNELNLVCDILTHKLDDPNFYVRDGACAALKYCYRHVVAANQNCFCTEHLTRFVTKTTCESPRLPI